MTRCTECGKKEEIPFTCNYCGQDFCARHRLPESHNCYAFKKVLNKHKKSWKHGNTSMKFKSEYNGAWENDKKEIYKTNEEEYKNWDVTKPCPNCGNQIKNHNFQCSICGREFCSKECAKPKTHGCEITTYSKSKQHPDKCSKCGTTKSKTFWDYDDGTTLCDNCDKIKRLKKIMLPGFILIMAILIIITFIIFVFNQPPAITNEKINVLTAIDFGSPRLSLEVAYQVDLEVESVYLKNGKDLLKQFDCIDGNCSERFWIDINFPTERIAKDNNHTIFRIKPINVEFCYRKSNSEKCKTITLTTDSKIYYKNCEQNLESNTCLSEKPLYCDNGKIIEKASICGCKDEYNFRKIGDTCEQIKRCDDGTEYNKCSSEKPFYCEDGNLINYSSKCGCPNDLVSDNELCVSKYQTGPKKQTYNYTLRSKNWEFEMITYKGLSEYQDSISTSTYTCYNGVCPSKESLALEGINEPEQKIALQPLIEMIDNMNIPDDDKARIAISIVQNIPYDNDKLYSITHDERYPYEVIYDHTGVCGEKSKLLAYLLKELGYSVALFNFEGDSHMALGIKCPKDYTYKDTEYCFVESTTPTIITYEPDTYVGVGKLKSTPTIIKVSDGKSFNTVSEEAKDAEEYKKILGMGTILTENWYNRWLNLVKKYGIQTSN